MENRPWLISLGSAVALLFYAPAAILACDWLIHAADFGSGTYLGILGGLACLIATVALVFIALLLMVLIPVGIDMQSDVNREAYYRRIRESMAADVRERLNRRDRDQFISDSKWVERG